LTQSSRLACRALAGASLHIASTDQLQSYNLEQRLDTQKLNSWLTLLANLGVLLGIVFLAIELRQNNELMESEARFNRVSVSKEGYNIQSTNGELAEIIVKVNNNAPLTEVELYRFTMLHMRLLINIEWMFREMPADSPERKYAERTIEWALSNKLRRQIYLDRTDLFDPEFVIWIEDNFLSN